MIFNGDKTCNIIQIFIDSFKTSSFYLKIIHISTVDTEYKLKFKMVKMANLKTLLN